MVQTEQTSDSGPASPGLSPDLIAAFAIVSLTFLTYASVISMFFIYADEAWVFGTYLARVNPWEEIVAAAVTQGRPVGMAIWWLQARLLDVDLDLLILHRISSLLPVAIIAYLCYRTLPRRELTRDGLGWICLATGLCLVVIPPAQIHAVFSSLFGASLCIILALVSYRWLDKRLGWLAVPPALFLCLITYQPAAFFVFVPFAADLWRRYEGGTDDIRRFAIWRGLTIVAIVLATSLVFTIWFKLISVGAETLVYDRAKPLFAPMNGDFGPFWTLLQSAEFGLNVFELWSYPPYAPYIWHKRYALYIAVLIALIALNVLAILAARSTEVRKRRLWTALGMTGAFLATLAPVFADGFSGRQNLYYPSQAVILIDIAFATACLARTMRDARMVTIVIATVVAAQSVLAASSVLATIIRPQLLAVDFVATRLRDSGIPPGSKVAVVIVMGKTQADCLFEPCLGYYGRRFNADFEYWQRGFYERIAQRYGYEIVAFGNAPKPNDPHSLNLGEPLIVIDVDELREIYRADQIQM